MSVPTFTKSARCTWLCFTLVLILSMGMPQGDTRNGAYLQNPCLKSAFSKLPFCNASLPTSARVKDLVSRLSVKEKIEAFNVHNPALTSIGLVEYNWWSEAAHGISNTRNDAKTPFQTNFPLPNTMGAAYNRTLWHAVGTQIGLEARAFMNAGNAYSTFWNVESPGEDPFLVGEYAVHFVRGFQENKADSRYWQASACCKHFVANQLEKWNGTDRHRFNAQVSAQDLQDSYLPPFKACVQQGKVSGLMCSYNAVNGVPSCANSWLLNKLARDTWGFDGYVTSDCGAVYDVFVWHHYTKSAEEAVSATLKAGMDIDCGDFISKHGQAALDKGLLTEADMDRALQRLFRIRMKLGHFDPDGPLQQIKTDVICSPAAVELARDAARQGTVLLKNEKALLPLQANSHQKILIVGPNLDLSKQMALYYGSNACFDRYSTIVDAFKQYNHHVRAVKGVASPSATRLENQSTIAAFLRTTDLVVFALGTDRLVESEGRDRVEIGLSKAQKELVAFVLDKLPKQARAMAVMFSGGPVDISILLENPRVEAIVHAGQPSVNVPGVADVVFGKVSPSGRMVQTIYPEDYINQISMFEAGLRPGKSQWPPFTTPGRTYRFYTGKPVLPFGYGLSYTTFKYLDHQSIPHLVLPEVESSFEESPERVVVEWKFVVVNTGDVDSDHVILGFVIGPNAGKGGRPKKSLVEFKRVHVRRDHVQEVTFELRARHFAVARYDGKLQVEEGEYTLELGLPETAATMGHVKKTFKILAKHSGTKEVGANVEPVQVDV